MTPPSDDRPTQPIEQAFRYCPWCRTPAAAIGSVPFKCPKCDFRFFFGPVAAVGGLVLNRKGQVLLVERARDPGKGHWGLPGGFVDRGESIEEALRREVLEETHLVVRTSELLTTGPNVYNYRGLVSDVVDLFYVCRVDNERDIELAADELSGYRWCIPRRKELDHMAFDSNREALKVWLKRRRA